MAEPEHHDPRALSLDAPLGDQRLRHGLPASAAGGPGRGTGGPGATIHACQQCAAGAGAARFPRHAVFLPAAGPASGGCRVAGGAADLARLSAERRRRAHGGRAHAGARRAGPDRRTRPRPRGDRRPRLGRDHRPPRGGASARPGRRDGFAGHPAPARLRAAADACAAEAVVLCSRLPVALGGGAAARERLRPARRADPPLVAGPGRGAGPPGFCRPARVNCPAGSAARHTGLLPGAERRVFQGRNLGRATGPAAGAGAADLRRGRRLHRGRDVRARRPVAPLCRWPGPGEAGRRRAFHAHRAPGGSGAAGGRIPGALHACRAGGQAHRRAHTPRRPFRPTRAAKSLRCRPSSISPRRPCCSRPFPCCSSATPRASWAWPA